MVIHAVIFTLNLGKKWPFKILIVLINHWLSTKMVPITIFSCNQAALRTLLSVRPSDTFWTMFLPSYQHEFSGAITIDKSDVHAKGPGQKSKVNVTEVKTNLAPIAPICMFPDCDSSLNSPMTMKWCAIVFQGHLFKYQSHTGQKIADFDPNWAFPDCNSSLNWPMAMK